MSSPIKKPNKVLVFPFQDDGIIPNSKLPLLIYKTVVEISRQSDPKEFVRKLVAPNRWEARWLWRIYKQTHYHSTAHETLAVVNGNANVQLGGPRVGEDLLVEAGDIIIIPAGVAHKCLEHSPDFSVVGMYPAGQNYDTVWKLKAERNRALKNIKLVPWPESDPFFGQSGPLFEHWK